MIEQFADAEDGGTHNMSLRRRIAFILIVVLALAMSSCAVSENFDLGRMTHSELKSLEQVIEAEIAANHTPSSKGRSAVEDAVKAEVESVFRKEGISVSWPWFDYDYTNSWGYYTFDTNFSYKNQQKKKIALEVNAIAYTPDDKQVTIMWLQIGDEVLIDNLGGINQPEVLTSLAEHYPDAGIVITDINSLLEEVPEPEAEENTIPTSTATPTPTPSPTPSPTPTITPTEQPLPSYEPLAKGSKGENVTKLQEQLGSFGYNVGTIDGAYGKKAETAVREFQSRVGLPVTGSADSITQMLLFSLPITASYVIDNVSSLYHMPGCEKALRVDGNHFEYCSDSITALEKAGYAACPDCKPVPAVTPTPKPTQEPTKKPTEKPVEKYSSSSGASDYVLNKNTKKFHEPWCSSVSTIKSKNRKDFTGTRDQVISMGYVPCKKCNP